MSDIADYELDALGEPFRDMYGNEYDGFDNVDCPYGEDGPAFRVAPLHSKTCKHCGTSGLFWGTVDGRWLLHDSEGVHACPVNLNGILSQ